MLPPFLSHEFVHSFKFWHNEQLCEGICSGKDLYRFYTVFKTHERKQAFAKALDITEQGYQVYVTCTRSEYKLWISLRRVLSQPNPASDDLMAA